VIISLSSAEVPPSPCFGLVVPYIWVLKEWADGTKYTCNRGDVSQIPSGIDRGEYDCVEQSGCSPWRGIRVGLRAREKKCRKLTQWRSYEALPPNYGLSHNMLAGAFAGIAVRTVEEQFG